MFGKKLLSIVGLLFIGNQIASVSADCVPSHSGLEYEAANYECNSCGSGDVGYYEVGGYLVKVTAAATCSGRIEVPGYYKLKDESFYKVVHTTYAASLAGTSGTCEIGKFVAGNFCLDGTNVLTMGDDGNFLFTDVDEVFTSDAASKVVLKSPDANSIVLNNGITSDDYCVSDIQKILERDDGYCGVNSCESFIYCAHGTGVCTDVTFTTDRNGRDTNLCNPSSSDSRSNCDPGYYILDAGNAGADFVETGDTNGILWKCNDNNGDCSAVSTTQIPYGYLKNAKATTSVPYIMCNGNGSTGTCTAITKGSIHKGDNECTGSRKGDIIENGDAYKLCVDGTSTPIELGGNDATVKYFIGYDGSATNIFSSKMLNGYYFMVDITADENVILHAREGELITKYKYTEGDLKVVEYSDEGRLSGICKSTSFTEFTKDYKEDDTVDYYKMGTPVEGPLVE